MAFRRDGTHHTVRHLLFLFTVGLLTQLAVTFIEMSHPEHCSKVSDLLSLVLFPLGRSTSSRTGTEKSSLPTSSTMVRKTHGFTSELLHLLGS